MSLDRALLLYHVGGYCFGAATGIGGMCFIAQAYKLEAMFFILVIGIPGIIMSVMGERKLRGLIGKPK